MRLEFGLNEIKGIAMIIFLVCGLSSCEHEPLEISFNPSENIELIDSCEVPIDLGIIEVSDSSIQFVSQYYWAEQKSITFISEDQEEIIFDFESITGDDNGPYASELPCPSDSNHVQRVIYDYERLVIYYRHADSLSLRITLRLNPRDNGYSHLVEVSVNKKPKNSSTIFSFGIIRYTSDPGTFSNSYFGLWNSSEFHESLSLLNSTFINVYSSIIVNSTNSQTFYTVEEGVIGFRDSDSKLWVIQD